MSVESIAIALNHSKATGTAKLVLIGIANHDGDGGAWPSMATLAKYGGCSVRNARKAVERLEELGEILRHVQGGGDWRTAHHKRPNRYIFRLACPASCDRSSAHRTHPDDELPPPVGIDRGVERDRGPRSDATAKPSSNQPTPTHLEERQVVNARERGQCEHPMIDDRHCVMGCMPVEAVGS